MDVINVENDNFTVYSIYNRITQHSIV